MTLAEVVIQNSAAAEIFDELNIDYFCRGNRVLGEALMERNISLTEFRGELARLGQANRICDWRAIPLQKLIEYIVNNHHTFLHGELPTLEQSIGQHAMVSRDNAVWLGELHKTIRRLQREVEIQMRKEEAILFPAISNLELAVKAGNPPIPSQFGSVANLSRVLGQDHNKSARELDEIRELTNNFTCPAGSHVALQALFQRLKNLATNMHRHVHLENNVLFPRAVALEKGELQ